ncbi:MAG: hypothetical protein KOO61_05010 [Spirochaetales bacterium]|nr:hypothetical protein [Spirochaetales bacterium]
MEPLRVAIDELVSAGIRSYIGLLGHGERTRSRRLFSDALQLSAMISGGPSARMSPVLVAEAPNGRPMMACVILLTIRSILATLLVLKTTAHWRRIPALEELQMSCVRVAGCMEEPIADTQPSGWSSAGTAPTLNCEKPHETDTTCGCRRNNALPTVPELAEHPVPVT